jgi:hypothetical protein
VPVSCSLRGLSGCAPAPQAGFVFNNKPTSTGLKNTLDRETVSLLQNGYFADVEKA